MNEGQKIAVLITCHNRHEKTVRCLRTLAVAAREVKNGNDAGRGAKVHVFLVDDGSTDGTAGAVTDWYRTNSTAFELHIIAGTGHLFWAKGMRLAWEKAVEQERVEGPFDFYLWLNDDVSLKESALAQLLSDWRTCGDSRGVIAGACSATPDESACSYGATDARNELVSPDGHVRRAGGWFTGNCVLIPRETVQMIGLISGEYTHARADFDYAERLKRAGIPFFTSSAYVGICPCDYAEKMRGKSLWERVTLLWRPGYLNLHDLWLIRSRYYGRIRAVISSLHLMICVLKGVK